MGIYEKRRREYHERERREKRRERTFTIARTLAGLAMVLFVVFVFYYEDFRWLYYFAGSLVLFLVLLYFHNNVRNRIKRWRAYQQINRSEEAAFLGDYSHLPSGDEFASEEHFYAYDLELFGDNSVFQYLNRSATYAGQTLLASWIRGQNLNEETEKHESIRELAQKVDFRQHWAVEPLLKEEDTNLRDKLRYWQETLAEQKKPLPLPLLYILSALAIGGLVYWLLILTMASFYLFAALLAINLLVFYSRSKDLLSLQREMEGVEQSLELYGSLIQLMENEHFNSSWLQKLKGRLRADVSAGEALQQLSRFVDLLGQMGNLLVSLIFNGLFLYHLHIQRKLWQWHKANGEAIFTWLDVADEMDAFSSLANFHFNHPAYCFPRIAAEPNFSGVKLGHPLIPARERVANDVDFNDFQIMILTGSNMAGKSTFLKTLGVNLVLAKMGAPVCADSLEIYPFPLLSSMKNHDSIARGESYFQAEITRLQSLLLKIEKGEPCFILLDEILRGTNSQDKKSGTRKFLQKLAQYPVSGVVATHDVDIADLAEEQSATFRAMFFESRFREGRLHFDYLLRPGVCTTPNATELMRSRGLIE